MAIDNEYLSDFGTDEVEVLRECLRVVDERAALERERGKSAESRAGTALGFLGVVAGALALLVGASADSSPSLSALAFVALATGLLAKASYFGLRAVGVQYGKTLDHYLARTMQGGDLAGALKSEIAWKRWEIDQVIRPNTARLFYLQRCQRSTFLAVFSLALAAVAMQVEVLDRDSTALGLLEWLAIGVVVAVLFGIDWLLERRGIWQRREGRKSPAQ